MTPEFSRPVRADTVGEAPRAIEIEANEAERRALGERFGLQAVERLTARFALSRVAAGILAEGQVQAAVVQSCVATAEPVPATVDERVRLLFSDAATDGEEVELGEADLDVLPMDGGTVELGEAAAETLALALDPFPRAPDAEAALRAAGVRTEEEARLERSPFAALKDRLGGADD